MVNRLNIFVLDDNPETAAQYHCDKHVVKMILESCQILCTVQHLKNSYSGIPYRKTHQAHPCVVWAMASQGNYDWLLELTKYLLLEYAYRYSKIHKSQQAHDWLIVHPSQFAKQERTEFVQVMPEIYQSAEPVAAYRSYYRLGKADILRYTRRPAPFWLKY